MSPGMEFEEKIRTTQHQTKREQKCPINSGECKKYVSLYKKMFSVLMFVYMYSYEGHLAKYRFALIYPAYLLVSNLEKIEIVEILSTVHSSFDATKLYDHI